MNPIALAGTWGFLKGLAAGRSTARRQVGSALGAFVTGPVIEEAMFRVPKIHPGLSSAVFAAVHLTPDMLRRDPTFSAFRFADVFAGGMMYSMAYKRFGFLGAVAAHMGHNVMCTLGALLSPRPGPRLCSAHHVRSARRSYRRSFRR